ncbi:MAG: tyrosine--tRNA ligase [Acidimicrobiia bacterium]
MTDVAEQMRVLTAGTVDCITPDELADRLGAGRPLRVKLGIDATASDIHLGFAVVLRKLRQFQELGHVAVLILGDFTAQVGDPSGRSATRPRLSPAEVDAHAATYVEQVHRILLPEPLEVRRNSEWLATMGIDDVLRLTARTTVARMLDRNDFADRYERGVPISVMELLYPLLQGWDSVMVEADVELGGTDQLFNILMGRQLQEQEGQAAQIVLTSPLLEGLDGTQKMSKSLGNYVGIAEPPDEQFGKLMSIPDELLPRYFELTTGWHPDRVETVVAELGEASGAGRNRLKRLLARTVVDLYHGEGAGAAAEAGFDRVFKAGQAPPDMPERTLERALFADGPVRLARVLAEAGLVTSNREGARRIREGAVRLDGNRAGDPEREVTAADVDGAEIQVGKRKWARVRVR